MGGGILVDWEHHHSKTEHLTLESTKRTSGSSAVIPITLISLASIVDNSMQVTILIQS